MKTKNEEIKAMPKNVILTVISTVNRNKNFYYHYHDVDDNGNDVMKFCDGIASIEPGTKYFLSNYDVDKIIVVASKETREKRNGQKLSDLEFFKKRISEFNSGKSKGKLSVGFKGIDKDRKRVLRSLVKVFMRKNGIDNKENWLEALTVDKKLYNGLCERINENINKNFLTESEISKYKEQSWDDVLSKTTEGKHVSADDFVSQLEKSNFSWLKKQAFCVIYKNELEKWLTDNVSAGDFREKAEEYYRDISRLISQIDAYKTHRIETETEFAKRYIYNCCSGRMFESKNSNKKIEDIISDVNDTFGAENVTNIIDEIKETGGKNAKDVKINLLIDIQGGNRTSAFIINSVISIFNNERNGNIKINKIVAINFERNNLSNEIVDETKRYEIGKLVSGMSSFIQYGKVGILDDLFKKTLETDDEKRILEYMRNIDYSLSICDITELTKNIKELKDIKSLKESDPTAINVQNSYMKAMLDSILNEFDTIDLDGNEIDIPSLTNWALKKEFYQQALTIIESKIPHYLVKHGIFVYCYDENKKNEIIEKLAKKYISLLEKDKWKMYDVDYYYINYCLFDMKNENAIEDKNKIVSQYNKNVKNNLIKGVHVNDTIKQYGYNDIKNIRNVTNHAGNKKKKNSKLSTAELKDILYKFINQVSSLKKSYAEKVTKTSVLITYDEVVKKASELQSSK